MGRSEKNKEKSSESQSGLVDAINIKERRTSFKHTQAVFKCHFLGISMHRFVLFLVLLSISILYGCSKVVKIELAMKQDYRGSLQSFYQGSVEKTLTELPDKEKNSFILTLEKAYLSLLLGKPRISDLERFSRLIEQRVRYRVSRELKSFFYLETQEGYYVSEHEVILLHLFLSWGYSLRTEYEKACVEARKASHLLNSRWSEEGGFDDSMLRIFAAGLWTMCGSWEDAKIDFRAAWKLDNSLQWARKLSNLQMPPKHLMIVLGGVGPVVYWKPGMRFNLVRGARNVKFRYKGRKSQLVVYDASGKRLDLLLSPNSAPWYRRHMVRDNEIQDLIKDSQYTEQSLSTAAIAGVNSAAGYATGFIVGSVAITAGIGVAYLGTQINVNEIITAGLGISTGGILYTIDRIKETTKENIRYLKEEMDASESYRFVRFLPEYIWTGWSFDEIFYPLSIQMKNGRDREFVVSGINPLVSGRIKVSLVHFADVYGVNRGRKVGSNQKNQGLSLDELMYLSGSKKKKNKPHSNESEISP